MSSNKNYVDCTTVFSMQNTGWKFINDVSNGEYFVPEAGLSRTLRGRCLITNQPTWLLGKAWGALSLSSKSSMKILTVCARKLEITNLECFLILVNFWAVFSANVLIKPFVVPRLV